MEAEFARVLELQEEAAQLAQQGRYDEALAACDGKAKGDACTVQIHDTTVNGVCDAPPNETRLGCRPSGPPPGQ